MFGEVSVVGFLLVVFERLEFDLAGSNVMEGSVDRKVEMMLLQIHLLYILDVYVEHSLSMHLE